MKDETYNGWTNYETWNCKLWIDNDQGSQEFWREAAKEAFDDSQRSGLFTREENAAVRLMDSLKDYHEANMPDLPEASFYTDIFNAALSQVNWYEIAKSLIDSLKE
jgi:hypothetical protein